MNICILTTSYPTWSEKHNEFMRGKFVHDMAKYLVKAGVDVHVITQHDKDTKSYEQKDGVHIHRFHYFFNNCESLTKDPGIPENIKRFKNKLLVPFYLFFLIVNALKVIYKYKTQIINAHWGFPTGYIGMILHKLTGRTLVTTLYGAEIFPFLKGKHTLIKPLLKSALTGSNIVAGISRETVRAAKTISGRNDIHLIPDGIDMEYYVPGDKNSALLSKYNCLGKQVVFFTGRMVERKGHKYVLEAMNIVKGNNSNVKLLLGGNGPLFPYLLALRSELGLEDVIEMPGFLPEDELVPILQSVDVHVLPSCVDSNGDTEGSATAAFEAMACGTPSLVSRIGGNIGAIEEGKGAYYFEPTNSHDLADRIVMLLSDKIMFDRNRSESRKYIQDHYSWEASISSYLQLIDARENSR